MKPGNFFFRLKAPQVDVGPTCNVDSVTGGILMNLRPANRFNSRLAAKKNENLKDWQNLPNLVVTLWLAAAKGLGAKAPLPPCAWGEGHHGEGRDVPCKLGSLVCWNWIAWEYRLTHKHCILFWSNSGSTITSRRETVQGSLLGLERFVGFSDPKKEGKNLRDSLLGPKWSVGFDDLNKKQKTTMTRWTR